MAATVLIQCMLKGCGLRAGSKTPCTSPDAHAQRLQLYQLQLWADSEGVQQQTGRSELQGMPGCNHRDCMLTNHPTALKWPVFQALFADLICRARVPRTRARSYFVMYLVVMRGRSVGCACPSLTSTLLPSSPISFWSSSPSP